MFNDCLTTAGIFLFLGSLVIWLVDASGSSTFSPVAVCRLYMHRRGTMEKP